MSKAPPRLAMACAFAVLLISIASMSCANPIAAVAGDDMLATADGQSRALGSTIRLVAGNISSGNNQSYDLGHGLRILQGLNPDVVMIQEFNYLTNSDADIEAFADAAMEGNGYWYREAGAQIPNGIISRYPILESGEWDDASVSNRDFAWARIDIPGSIDLWAVSVHILTSSASVRNTESIQLVSYIKSKIPTGDYLAIGGDFNTSTKTEACYTSLSQVVGVVGPFPVCSSGDSDTNAGRTKPYDAVLVDADLAAYKVAVAIGSRTFANGLVVDTRTYTPISDLSPALSGDSGSTNMQHMAIVRDFFVPADVVDPEPDPEPTGTLAFAKSDMESGGPAGLPSGGAISTAAYAGLGSFRYQKTVSSSLTVPMTSSKFYAPAAGKTKLTFWFKGTVSGSAPGLRFQVAAGGTAINYYDLNGIVSGTTLTLNPTAGGAYPTAAINVAQWTKVELNLTGVNWGGLTMSDYALTFRVRSTSTHDWYIDDVQFE